jgi:REP element-mobilizing transposase RayT
VSKFRNKYRNETTRLNFWDYGEAGWYYVTIVTKHRKKLFGKIINGEMKLNDAGQNAFDCWMQIPIHFPHAMLDEFVIMPNHVHGIIVITKKINSNEMKKYDTAGTQNDVGIRNTVGTQNFASLREYFATPHKNFATPHKNFATPHKNFTSPRKQMKSGNKFGPQSKNLGSIIRGFKIGVTNWYRERGIGDTIWQSRYYDHIIRDENDLNRIRNYIINNPKNWRDDNNYE